MYIYTYILIYMQIYIKPYLEQKLREEDNMSKLVNDLLAEHYGTAIPTKEDDKPIKRRPVFEPGKVYNLDTGEILHEGKEAEKQEEEPWYTETLFGWRKDYPAYKFRFNDAKDIIEVFHIGQQKWLNVDEVDLTN